MADKKKALETALAQIEKAYGKGTIMRLGENSGMNVEAISTGSVSLDVATGIGGLPKGRIIEIYGPESSGKTTLALTVIAQAQKNGGEAAFIDAEHALDPTYASNLGVDVDALYEKLSSNKIINWFVNTFYKGTALTTKPAAEPSDIPQTGSAASVAVFATLSLAAAAAFVSFKKKEA